MPRKRLRSVEYSTRPRAAANATRFAGVKPEISGSSRAAAIAVRHAPVAGDRGRLHELVGFAAAVSGLDRLPRALGGLPGSFHDNPISLLDPVPALVAIHRIIAAAQGGDLKALEAGEVALEFLHVGCSRLGRRVAPVEEGVDGNRYSFFGEDACERGYLALVRMHAARR